MRRDDYLKTRVDRIAIEKCGTRNKQGTPAGPVIVKHDNKKISENHGANREWAPLDMY